MLALLRRTRAVVLLVTVAVLSVLAILATVFATMSGIERAVARNYVDLVRAKLLAESGIELGTRVLRDPTVTAARRTYWGEDHNASGNLANGWGVTEDVYRPNGQANTLQVLDCPLSYALRPSLYADFTPQNLRPDTITIRDASAPGGTRQVGYSGRLAGTYQALGDTFSVKLVGENDIVDVNDIMIDANGIVIEPNTRMARVINVLAQALGLPANSGTMIANWRALYAPVSLVTANNAGNIPEITGIRGGYVSVEQLAQFLPPNSYNVLRNYLTVNAWRDLSTIRPQPQSFAGVSPSSAYNLGVTPPDRYNFRYRFEPRCPVDVNSAPWPVLAALLSGLQANYVAVVPAAYSGGTQTERYEVRSVSIPAYSGPGSLPGQIATGIVAYRAGANGPIDTWEEFDTVLNGIGGLNAVQRKLLMAHFNPNTRSMRPNPDRCMRFRVGSSAGDVDIDKTDLVVYSTEFCFTPKGVFTLASLGRVLDEAGNVVAQHEIRTVVRAFDAVRHTTARDFRRNSVSFATQYVATLPDSPPDHTSGGGLEDRELNSAFDVPVNDTRWAYDGGITQRTRDPNGVLEMYTWPSTTQAQGGGTYFARNTAQPGLAGRGTTRPREDRSLWGPPATGATGPGDSIKGDIFSDGIYLGTDRYRALTYALTWPVATPSQGASGPQMSMEYWMKPNCEGSGMTNMRRGFQFVRTSLGNSTVQMKIWRFVGANRVQWTGMYGQLGFNPWCEQTSGFAHGNTLWMIGSAGFSINAFTWQGVVGGAPNEKYGVLWWWSGGLNRRLFAGMWHHFYLGAWDDGYYTASDMYVDGVRQSGNLIRYGDPGSGWVTYPGLFLMGNMLWLILWTDRWEDFTSLMDVANTNHGPVFGDEAGLDMDRFLSGTLDGFRSRPSRQPPVTVPSRLNPGVNAQYGGVIPRTTGAAPDVPQFPGKEMPAGSQLRVLSMEWTRYRPTLAYDGSTIPAGNRPTTTLSYGTTNSGFPYTLADTTGRSNTINFLISPSQTFQYRVRFTNNNLFPLRESAYFDDITLHYFSASSPVQFLSWQVYYGD